MSFIFYATNLILLASFVVLVRQVVRAPEGHEDEAGFHFGAPSPEQVVRQVAPVRRASSYAEVPSRHVAA